MARKPVIGTRGSALALWQARRVASLLGIDAEIKIVKTAGDRMEGALAGRGQDVGFFTREIEKKLLQRAVDIAVHSLKDLPTSIPEGLSVAATLERDYAADVLITLPGRLESHDPADFREGTRIGTSSLRRRALSARYIPLAVTTPMRGNVDTRIRKLKEGQCDAVVLARAGVERLSRALDGLVVLEMNPHVWVPSAGQGVIAVETRDGDAGMRDLCAGINHDKTRTAAAIERELMRLAGGGCHAPFGAFAEPVPGSDDWRVFCGSLDEKGEWKSASMQGKASSLARETLGLLKSGRNREADVEEEALCRPL